MRMPSVILQYIYAIVDTENNAPIKCHIHPIQYISLPSSTYHSHPVHIDPIQYILIPSSTYHSHPVHITPIRYISLPSGTYRSHSVHIAPIRYISLPSGTYRSHPVHIDPMEGLCQLCTTLFIYIQLARDLEAEASCDCFLLCVSVKPNQIY